MKKVLVVALLALALAPAGNARAATWHYCALVAKGGSVELMLTSQNVTRLGAECYAIKQSMGALFLAPKWDPPRLAAGISGTALCSYARGADVFAVYSQPSLASSERRIFCAAATNGQWKRMP